MSPARPSTPGYWRCCRGLPSPDVARALRIRADAHVWRLRRLRMIDGQPAVVETSIIPVALAPDLDQQVRPAGRLAVRPAGRRVRPGGRVRGAVPRGGAARARRNAALLTIPPRTQVVRIRGLSMDKSGTPFDCFEQLYPATEFAFAISGSTARHLLPTPGFQDWDLRALPERPVRPGPRAGAACPARASPGPRPGPADPPASSTRIAGRSGRRRAICRKTCAISSKAAIMPHCARPGRASIVSAHT